MPFQSFQFLIFFPLVTVLYYIVPSRFKPAYLLAVSLLFYGAAGTVYIGLLAGVVLITYGMGILLGRVNVCRRLLLCVVLLFLLGILWYFKYYSFSLETICRLLRRFGKYTDVKRTEIVLPLGISFYLFSVIGYLIDVYRTREYEKNIISYGLFVCFFPKLTQGPIESHKHFIPQIYENHPFRINNVRYGLTRMLYGYFQKMVIADNMAGIVDRVYLSWPDRSGAELLLMVLLFTIQIYCDFDGYTNIALGAAQTMGFHLNENFESPYLSVSVAEFWRRWHISLSEWLKRYIYIPLGGSRKGLLRKYINIMIVFLVSGFWHGASWHFVIWGILNGIFQIGEDLIKRCIHRIRATIGLSAKKGFQLGQCLYTFILISISWVFFRATGTRDACHILKRIVTEWDPWLFVEDRFYELFGGIQIFHLLCLSCAIVVAVDLCRYKKISLNQKLQNQGVVVQYMVYISLLFFIMIFGRYGSGFDISQFIYTQF